MDRSKNESHKKEKFVQLWMMLAPDDLPIRQHWAVRDRIAVICEKYPELEPVGIYYKGFALPGEDHLGEYQVYGLDIDAWFKTLDEAGEYLRNSLGG